MLLLSILSCRKKDSIVTGQTGPSNLVGKSVNASTASSLVLSQTRTANNFYIVSPNMYVQWGAQYLAADDNSYAYSKRLNSLQRVYLILQDFGFTIPSGAVIENITVQVRKFKTDRGELKDCLVHLLSADAYGGWLHYGVEMANVVDLWPATETLSIYSQSGSGNNGIKDLEQHTTQPYQWTPELINDSSFGLYFLTNFPAKGFCHVYFDQVQITVEYTS
jgi:hypothetical protein